LNTLNFDMPAAVVDRSDGLRLSGRCICARRSRSGFEYFLMRAEKFGGWAVVQDGRLGLLTDT